jgi:hypothetical protein
MPTVDSEVAANLVTNNTKLHTSNYWSPLACLVKEQEESSSGSTTNVEMAMSALAIRIPSNKVAAHWAQKLQNRKSRRFVFLDSGATSGAAPEEDAPDLDNTGQPSQKTFMFPDGRIGKATKKMLLKHNLRLAAREMNIVPGLQSALISILKLATQGTPQSSTKMAQLSKMTKQQWLWPKIPPSWNQNAADTPECGH